MWTTVIRPFVCLSRAAFSLAQYVTTQMGRINGLPILHYQFGGLENADVRECHTGTI